MKLPKVPNLANLSRRERMLVAGSVLVLCVVALDQLVLGPWWRHIANIGREITRLESSVAGYHQLLRRSPQIQGEIEMYTEYMRPAEAEQPTLATLLREIESLGEQSGISLGEVKPLEGSTNSLYQEFAIQVQYRGSLEQWVHFVYLLETSKSLFTIERLAVDRSSEDPGVLEGTVRLTSRAANTGAPAQAPATAS